MHGACHEHKVSSCWFSFQIALDVKKGIHTCKHAHTHIHTHTYTHAHTYTHTHTGGYGGGMGMRGAAAAGRHKM